jgi:glycosyltransferase involved in cell wall biosynthesis
MVIPFQENLSELKKTLNSLIESLKGQENFEIVLVDDSFGTDSWQEIAALFPEHKNYFSYVKLERKAARVRGDETFRAGVARNIGVIHSRGQELIFLDSDILLGSGFWQALRDARKNHNGPLMPRRRQLLSSAQTENKTHEDFHPFEDTQLSFGGHWEQFYREWQTEANAWKWTSTYCLSLSRQTFLKLGGFHRSFYCYGFEDTELGYKLSKVNQNLQIVDADVYHLPVLQGRSEYKGEQNQRKQILGQSFQVLLRATLDTNLIELFQHVISK